MKPITLSISAVERDTGLSKDTLRVWERRYGFPVPERDGIGERAYPLEQVERLRIVKRLLDAGHRPGRVVALPVEELVRLSDSTGVGPHRSGDPTLAPDLRAYLDGVRAHDVESLRRQLGQAQARLGLGRRAIDRDQPEVGGTECAFTIARRGERGVDFRRGGFHAEGRCPEGVARVGSGKGDAVPSLQIAESGSSATPRLFGLEYLVALC